MQTQTEIVDYEKEKKELKNADEYWKPKAGRHKLTFFSEAQPAQYVDKKTGDIQPQKKFDIEVLGKKYIWTIPKGIKPSSLWGQITLFACEQGSLTGKTITLLVTGEGSDKRYVVEESLGLGGSS